MSIKDEFKRKAQTEPDRHYPVEALKEEGFERRKCKCGNYFWSVSERVVCGEPKCSGGYAFINNSPAREKMDFIQTWERFARLFQKLGYTPIPRYPVVARWRDDVDFVQASIYDFQPYCVSGEVDPPANPLVVPQFCLRFNDTDNVGVTGRHYTGFVMIGQHAFRHDYDANEYLKHIYAWLVEGMKIPKEEIQFHEDVWMGGGNMGPSMEFFSRGLEIGNQVYMIYEVRKDALKELPLKVLDMGMGQERPAWFSLGTSTSYDATFPPVVDFLFKKTGIRQDKELIQRFWSCSGILDIEEENTWEVIAERMGLDIRHLKFLISEIAALYSIGDHTRSLLFALADGALPSNVGGGYNLRMLVRRSFDLIARYGWDISLPEICEIHAKYLKPQYPELVEHLEEVKEILDVEKEKYKETKKKSKRIVERLKGREISTEELIELYDSHGISPEMLQREELRIKVPPDFFIKVAQRHESKTKPREHVIEIDVEGVRKTEVLYYDDYRFIEFEAKVEKILDGKYVILDKTAFYPYSGGQLCDTGYIHNSKVINVFKQGNVIVHEVESPSFKEGAEVTCRIDWERRKQLTQHHTSTHIINGVARKLLGEHVWQAGAEKTLEKSRLDITHFSTLDRKKLKKMEKEANKVIENNLKVEKEMCRRDLAEAKFGFRLYQGGAVPGEKIRVVRIGDLDTEACGGTHLNFTGEAGRIKIVGCTKIQDGVVRLEYVAGDAAKKHMVENVLKPYVDIFNYLGSDPRTRPLTLENEKLTQAKRILRLSTLGEEEFSFLDSISDEMEKACEIFSVNLGQLKETMERFLNEIFEDCASINQKRKELCMEELDEKFKFGMPLPLICDSIFKRWKKQKKELKKLSEELAKKRIEDFSFTKIGEYEFLCDEIKGGFEDLQRIVKRLKGERRIIVLFGLNEKIYVVGSRGKKVDINIGELVKRASEILGGGGGGNQEFGRGAGVKKEELGKAKEWVEEYIKKWTF